MYDLLIFILVILILISIRGIYGVTHTEIGDAGASAIRVKSILGIVIGFVILGYVVCMTQIYTPVPPKGAMVFLICMALFVFLMAWLRLYGLKKEKTVQLEITILRNLSYRSIHRIYWYTILIGESDGNNRNSFYFRGIDYKYLKECKEKGYTALKIEYYPNNGRIYRVTPYK